MNNICFVGNIGKANNISDLQYKVEVIGKRGIYEDNQLESIDVKLDKMKASIEVIYLLLQMFIQYFSVFFLWVDYLCSKLKIKCGF